MCLQFYFYMYYMVMKPEIAGNFHPPMINLLKDTQSQDFTVKYFNCVLYFDLMKHGNSGFHFWSTEEPILICFWESPFPK